MTGSGLDSRVRFPAWIFLSAIAVGSSLRPTKPLIQHEPAAISPEVRRPDFEADHSPPRTAEVKNAWSVTPTPLYIFMAWYLIKQRMTSAKLSYLEFPAAMLLLLLTAWTIEGWLAADSDELAFRLAHRNESLFACRHIMLPHCVVTCEISRVDPREVWRLEPADLAVAVSEEARAVRPRYQVSEVVLWRRRGGYFRNRRAGQRWDTYWCDQGSWRARVHISHSVKSSWTQNSNK
jgi:hypothetical protein